MKKNRLILVLFFVTFILPHNISSQIHIKGNVNIDMNSGLFSCDFNLSNIPELEDYRILLNKGMNIKFFKDNKGELINYAGHYDGEIKGEAIAYAIDNSTINHETFQITYKGAFPIYANDFNAFDYKGVIAFNGQTVRATEQTKWYPVIYDLANDKLINSYTYDLTISIKGGTTIFINGTAPKNGESSHFVSKKAHPLLLFAGNYDVVENNGDYILNTSVTKENSAKIFNNIKLIKTTLSKNIGVEFTDNIYLINHSAVNKRRIGSSWGFNTYPTFAFTGLDFNNLIDENGKFTNNNYKYFGHEFGHNYFGNNVMSGNLNWFWLESFAEYLSFNVAEDLCGTNFLKEIMLSQVKAIKDGSFLPLTKIENKKQIGEKYRYILGPLMLKCFEDTFGREKMNGVINSLLKFAETETLTIELWRDAAIKNGIDKDAFKAFEKKFIDHKKFKQHIIEEILKNYS